MFKFDRDKFFNEYRRYHTRLRGRDLTPRQRESLSYLLGQIEQDSIWLCIEHISYATATTGHETAYTFEPIDEIGSKGYFERRYGWLTPVGKRLGNDAPGEGAKYHGRGDVQVTGETNYERLELDLRKHYPALIAEFEERTGQHFDLTDYPDQAKDKAIAYAIMAFGMYHGRFTGKGFDDFAPTEYVKMRAIINGRDKAAQIATLAGIFERCFRLATVIEQPAPVETAAVEAPAQSLSTPVELAKIEPHTTDATTAFEAIKSYGMAAAKALGITSVGGALATAGSWATGVHIPAEYVTYVLIALAALIFLVVLFGGFALVVYVLGRFILTGLRESQAHKLNLVVAESVRNQGMQAVTFVGGRA